MQRAVVIGSGPNGLAAANELRERDFDVTVIEAEDRLGGGAQSGYELFPGLVQDHCAAVHPLARVSPYLRSLNLDVRWRSAPIECAHPLDGGDAAFLHRSIHDTAAELGRGGAGWKRLFGISSSRFADLSADLLAPPIHWPAHPLLFGQFGVSALLPPAHLARVLGGSRAAALYAGVAAHAFQPLSRPLVGAIGAALIAAAHGVGWPVVEGGTGVLTAAIIDRLRVNGVRFETGRRIRRLADLPAHDVAVFDVHPHAVARILGDELPVRQRRRFERFRAGPAAFKVDFAVEGGVPWQNDRVDGAGTVHLGGSASEIAAAERDVARGRMPARPFVLVGQQAVADPSRRFGDITPLYAYAHVPHGYQGDATTAIVNQIERFAPGFRDRIVAHRSTSPAEFGRSNANFVGGDILTGAKSPLQFLAGAAPLWRPYDTGIDGYYMCSAATPPGPGIHGMSGFHAGRRAAARAVAP